MTSTKKYLNCHSTLKQAALEYAAAGIPIMPLLPNSDEVIDELYYADAATTDPEQIEAWWNENPMFNIGVEIEFGYEVIELSVDPLKKVDGNKALAEFEEKHGPLPPTASITDDHGHRWIAYGGCFGGPDYWPYPGVEILTHRCFIPLPPSIIGQHALRWETQRTFDDITEEDYRVYRFLFPPEDKADKTPLDHFKHLVANDPKNLPVDYTVSEGERHSFLYENLKYMYDIGYPPAVATVNVLEMNKLYCNPPLPADRLENEIYKAWCTFRRGRGVEEYVG